MHYLDLNEISEHSNELINPTSAEKVPAVGLMAGLEAGDRASDFGWGIYLLNLVRHA